MTKLLRAKNSQSARPLLLHLWSGFFCHWSLLILTISLTTSDHFKNGNLATKTIFENSLAIKLKNVNTSKDQ